jgi:hypothetical protein
MSYSRMASRPRRGTRGGVEAAVLVLMLPAFVLLWAVAVATIAAIVR